MGPLSGLRVLDLGRVLAAPWAGQILGDLGADVVKIERPNTGDEARHYGLEVKTSDGEPTLAAMFLVANRNKRSVTIDFSKPEGATLVRRLATHADILIENFLPGSLAKFGLDYETLKAVNSRLIYCSITGFGQSGPRSRQPGYDGVFQAMGGLMSVTGHPDDVPGGGPMKAGPSIVDVATGYVAVIGILSAVHQRDLTGRGQAVDCSLLDTVVSLQSSVVQSYLLSKTPPERKGTDGNGGSPARAFTCSDGEIYISAGQQTHYEALCRVLGLERLIDDPRFADNRLRFDNRVAWLEAAGPVIKTWSKHDLEVKLTAARVPVGVVNDYEELFADPQVVFRGLSERCQNPLNAAHQIDILKSPIRLSEASISTTRPPPTLGQHTEEVLVDRLGLDAATLERLKAGKVI